LIISRKRFKSLNDDYRMRCPGFEPERVCYTVRNDSEGQVLTQIFGLIEFGDGKVKIVNLIPKEGELFDV